MSKVSAPMDVSQRTVSAAQAAIEAAEAHLRSHLKSIGADATNGGRELLALYKRDYHTCQCEMPYVERKWSEAIGVFTEIRLCCLAKAVEKLTGLRLFEIFTFTPLWTWKCEEMVSQPDGTWAERGCPPEFMLARMKERGIVVEHGKGQH